MAARSGRDATQSRITNLVRTAGGAGPGALGADLIGTVKTLSAAVETNTADGTATADAGA